MLIGGATLRAEIAARRRPDRSVRELSPAIDLGSAAEILAAFEDRAPLVLRHPKRKNGPAAPDGGFDLALETSGSTGEPRLALFSRAAIEAQAAASAAVLGWGPRDRWLICLSLAHAGGLAPLLRCAWSDRPAILVERFDPGKVAAAARDLGATVISLVPTMLAALLDDDWRPPASLRTALIGGAPASASLLERARRRRVPVVIAYGMTETFSHIALDGQLLPGVEARVEGGVIEVRGPMLFAGYAGEPPRPAGGWHHTGDAGHLEGGRLVVDGRADEVIISGGENVAPARVERALLAIDGIAEACVFALPDPRWGERVAAAIVGDPPIDLDRQLAGVLAPFERPRQMWIVDDPPRLASGKLDRRSLAAVLRSAMLGSVR